MDELVIKSLMMKNFITNLIRKKVKTQTGLDVTININDFEVNTDKGSGKLHLDIDAYMNETEIQKLFSQIIRKL